MPANNYRSLFLSLNPATPKGMLPGLFLKMVFMATHRRMPGGSFNAIIM
jgi:hypothetical protein